MKHNHLDHHIYFKRKRFMMRMSIIFFIVMGFIVIGVSIMAICGVFKSHDASATGTLNVDATNKDTQQTAQGTKHNDDYFINVPYISQQGNFPTACEIVSSVMLLQYYGYNITVDNFIDDYLPQSYLVRDETTGRTVGQSPNQAFIGDPRDASGYGCYAPVIVKAMNSIVQNSATAMNTTGTSIDDLEDTYIKNGIPVLVWASIDLKPTYASDSWYLKDTGQLFTWTAGEHCMVLVGEDDSTYYFNDPYNSNGIVRYDKKLVTERWKELGEQSVVLLAQNHDGKGAA